MITKEKRKAKFHLRSKLKMNWTNDTRTDVASSLNILIFMAIKERWVPRGQKCSNACFKVDIEAPNCEGWPLARGDNRLLDDFG